ncbi:hypothetical protein PJO48_29670, partial [Mycobacterium kansasii]
PQKYLTFGDPSYPIFGSFLLNVNCFCVPLALYSQAVDGKVPIWEIFWARFSRHGPISSTVRMY